MHLHKLETLETKKNLLNADWTSGIARTSSILPDKPASEIFNPTQSMSSDTDVCLTFCAIAPIACAAATRVSQFLLRKYWDTCLHKLTVKDWLNVINSIATDSSENTKYATQINNNNNVNIKSEMKPQKIMTFFKRDVKSWGWDFAISPNWRAAVNLVACVEPAIRIPLRKTPTQMWQLMEI